MSGLRRRLLSANVPLVFRVARFVLPVFLVVAPLRAQQPAPTPPPPEPWATLDALNLGELQEAINLLRANYIRSGDVDDRAIARATLAGLLARLDNGASLLPNRNAPTPGEAVTKLPDAFHAETLPDHTGYVRLGALNKEHLGDLDRTLKGFADQQVAAVILDLRATPASGDFELAAEVMRRFVAKGQPLFTLKKPNTNQERLFTANADPLFNGLVILLVDHDTSGAVETIPAVIRERDRALVVGAPMAGRAVEYADLGLAGGRVLRVAVSQVLLPGNTSVFPEGVKPDVAAPFAREDKLKVLAESLDKGVGPYVFETERPHMSEAALVSGVNPELDAAKDAQEARRRGGAAPKPPLRDVPLQRALDLVSTIGVFGPKAP